MPTETDADLVEMLRAAWCSDADIDETLNGEMGHYFGFHDLKRLSAWSNARRDAAVAERDIRLGRLKAAFRINALRWCPGMSHAEIDAELERIFADTSPDPREAEIVRLRQALEPFARADRAIGNEPGPFRFETGTGHRVIEREDLRRAATVLATPDHPQGVPAAIPSPPPAWLPHATFAAMSAAIRDAITGTGTSIADWQANAGLIAALGVLPDADVMVERMLDQLRAGHEWKSSMRATLGAAFEPTSTETAP